VISSPEGAKPEEMFRCIKHKKSFGWIPYDVSGDWQMRAWRDQNTVSLHLAMCREDPAPTEILLVCALKQGRESEGWKTYDRKDTTHIDFADGSADAVKFGNVGWLSKS
jgi:hypothetical protein